MPPNEFTGFARATKSYKHRQEQKFVQIFLMTMISTKQNHIQKQHTTLHLYILLL